MTSRKQLFALGSGLLLGVAGVANADDAALQAKIDALTAKVAQLEGQKSESWLNQQRAEEVKALVREVLADADTRASLLENGMTAGHNGKNFFLASEDGNFRLNVGGQIQVRYIANFRSEEDSSDTSQDDNEAGFEVNRVKLRFDGHIGSPRLMYTVQLATGRDTSSSEGVVLAPGGGAAAVGASTDSSSNAVFVDEATIAYQLTDNLVISGGRFKDTFLREDMTDSRYQLAIERSVVSAIFGTGRVEGLAATWTNDTFRANLTINDGPGSGEVNNDSGAAYPLTKNFNNDASDFAITGRLDVKLMGSWDQIRDFSAWSGQETSLVIGAAVNWDNVDTGLANTVGAPPTPPLNPDFNGGFGSGLGDNRLSWTVDGSFETAGLSIYAAIVGQHVEGTENAGDNGWDNYGAVVQAGYMVIPDKLEPYVRYEWVNIDDDDNATSGTGPTDVHIITVGANYYFRQHAAKFSADAVYAFQSTSGDDSSIFSVPGANTGHTGLLDDVNDDAGQLVLRAQFQLLF